MGEISPYLSGVFGLRSLCLLLYSPPICAGAVDGGGGSKGDKRRARWLFNMVQQAGGGHTADAQTWNAGSRQCRRHHIGLRGTVESGNHDVRLDRDAHMLQRGHEMQGEKIVGAEKSVRKL